MKSVRLVEIMVPSLHIFGLKTNFCTTSADLEHYDEILLRMLVENDRARTTPAVFCLSKSKT